MDFDKWPALLDCPFCGEIATLAHDQDRDQWQVVCTFCGGSVGATSIRYDTPGAVIRAWNTRGGVTTDQENIK